MAAENGAGRRLRNMAIALTFAILLLSRGFAQQPPDLHWVASWAASQQIPESQNALPREYLCDATLRQIVHLSIGGQQVRVHLSNVFGTSPLHITAVHIARPLSPSGPAIDASTDAYLSFSGAPDITIPAGAEYISDPVAYSVSPLSDLAITMHLDAPPEGETSHPASHATSYLEHGDLVGMEDLPGAKRFDHWFQLAGVDVIAGPQPASVVVLGDSITDGHGSTTNGNDRWPDVLAQRLQANLSTRSLGVSNQGIGGNRLLLDGLGPNALARFDRDVLAQPGVRYVVLLEGVNDLGSATRDAEISQEQHDALVARILGAYGQMIERAHEHGIKIFGGTITPYTGSDYYHPAPISEVDRQRINTWIRTAGHFDAVIDFDKTVRDPAHMDKLLPAYDSGDHLHPSAAGYRAMGYAVPLSLFAAPGRAYRTPAP
jgi:lysophospholipase L1-like esterase